MNRDERDEVRASVDDLLCILFNGRTVPGLFSMRTAVDRRYQSAMSDSDSCGEMVYAAALEWLCDQQPDPEEVRPVDAANREEAE